MKKLKFLSLVMMGPIFFTLILSCSKEVIVSTSTKSLRNNIFVKNAAGHLFSYDIKTQINNNKTIGYVSKNEVVLLGKSLFSEMIKPFYYNFSDVNNLDQYISEGKIWFIPNKNEIKPFKIANKNKITSRRSNNTTGTIDCECETAGQGEGNNECEFDDSDGIPQCWYSSCMDCDFIVCFDHASTRMCLDLTHGGGVFVLADSIVMTDSLNTTYVLGQNTILKFEFYETETICFREQFEITLYSNGLYNLNIPNINNISNIDSLWFVPFEENVQAKNGTDANPTCEIKSCGGTCDIEQGSDGCQRCKCSTDGSYTGCTLKPYGLANGGVLLYADSLTIIDL